MTEKSSNDDNDDRNDNYDGNFDDNDEEITRKHISSFQQKCTIA